MFLRLFCIVIVHVTQEVLFLRNDWKAGPQGQELHCPRPTLDRCEVLYGERNRRNGGISESTAG
jgi:hypothetical protein